MYGGILHKFKHTAASGADNIPNAVNWANVQWDDLDVSGNVSSQQITGITSSITIKINRASTATDLYYKIGSSNETGTINNEPFNIGYTLINDNGTFSISNNQWLTFACYGSTNAGPTTVTVRNNSDSDTSLDTFTITSIGP